MAHGVVCHFDLPHIAQKVADWTRREGRPRADEMAHGAVCRFELPHVAENNRRVTRVDSSLWPQRTVPKLPSGTNGCQTLKTATLNTSYFCQKRPLCQPPPSPTPPPNSHFVRKVKLRLAYRLAFVTSIELKKRNPCPLVWMRAPARIVFLESLQLHLSCSQLQPPGRMDTANLSTRSWPYSWWIRDDSDHFISRSTHSKAQNHWMRYDMIGYDRIWWNYKLHDTCFKQSAQLSGSRCMKNASGSSCLSWHAWSGTLHRIKRSCPQEQRITPHEWSLAASCKKNANVSNISINTRS